MENDFTNFAQFFAQGANVLKVDADEFMPKAEVVDAAMNLTGITFETIVDKAPAVSPPACEDESTAAVSPQACEDESTVEVWKGQGPMSDNYLLLKNKGGHANQCTIIFEHEGNEVKLRFTKTLLREDQVAKAETIWDGRKFVAEDSSVFKVDADELMPKTKVDDVPGSFSKSYTEGDQMKQK
eukprot:GHVP01053129.1.p1 GENE.GHVP01053129.1~~GHVP01053129.1.p1  ORF type:complete len:183 (+),score=35.79 GHVP01053129.1:80-628(+)